MGDSPKDDMTVVVACVSVGYWRQNSGESLQGYV
jgi:hypothetical protein